MLKIAPTLFRRCAEDRRGSVAIMFAFSIFALVGTVGLAIDFGRAFRLNSEIRAALDAAVLGAISVSSDSKTARATSIFKANNPNTFGATVTPTFALAGDGTFSGTVSVNLPTTFAKVFHVEQMTFTVGSKARSAPR